MMTTSAEGSPQEVFAAAPRTLYLKSDDASITFDQPDADGRFSGGVARLGAASSAAKRVTIAPLTPDELAAHQGAYYSDELGVLYTVTGKDGDLFLRIGESNSKLARGAGASFFAPSVRIEFDCPSPTRCDGMMLDAGRVLRLKFRKVTLVPTAPTP